MLISIVDLRKLQGCHYPTTPAKIIRKNIVLFVLSKTNYQIC